MVVAGVALMFTGVGGAAGIAVMAASSGLMNMGASMITQKLTTGKVNLTQTLTDGAIGMATGVVAVGTSVNAVKTVSTVMRSGIGVSRSKLVGTGVSVAKDMTLDGMSVVLESRITGEPVSVGDVLQAVALGRFTGWSTGGINSAVGEVIANRSSGVLKKYSETISEGIAEVSGSAFQYGMTTPLEDRSLGDFVASVGIDTSTGWGSSWSSRKISQSLNGNTTDSDSGGVDTSGSASLSSNEILMSEFFAGSMLDMSAMAFNISLKGVYEGFSLSDPQSETDAQNADVSDTDMQIEDTDVSSTKDISEVN